MELPSLTSALVIPTMSTHMSSGSSWAHLSKVGCTAAMDGGVPARGGPGRMARPAEEGCEGALAAAKKAPALLWRRPASKQPGGQARLEHHNSIQACRGHTVHCKHLVLIAIEAGQVRWHQCNSRYKCNGCC